MAGVRVFAPAKINLTLHVTGQRPDGYHLIDSLVAFADVGDTLTMRAATDTRLTLTGPESAGLELAGNNLVTQALDHVGGAAQVVLDKHLPVSSGIGGGSADAAAALRGIAALRGDAPCPADIALPLGADVPMCVSPRPWRVTGIGETLTQATLPTLPALLVNPRVPVPTAAVFRAMTQRDNAAMPRMLPDLSDVATTVRWLATQRNDLTKAAISSAPQTAAVLAALSALDAALLTRMSGSGATCFALFETQTAAQAAAAQVSQRHPDWWVRATQLGDQRAAAKPMDLAE